MLQRFAAYAMGSVSSCLGQALGLLIDPYDSKVGVIRHTIPNQPAKP